MAEHKGIDLQSFADALDGFVRSIDALHKGNEACKMPKLREQATQQERREALVEALNQLADIRPESALSRTETEECVEFFRNLYSDGAAYRHLYSDVCAVMYAFLSQNADELDAGVPYKARSLANNMELICGEIEGRSDISDSTKKSVSKLYDHIELENTRMEYFAKQNKVSIDSARKLQDDVASVGERVEAMQGKLQRDNVTILGIFSAIVVAFTAGSSFSSSVLQNMSSVGAYRLLFIVLALGLIMFDLVMALFFFVCRVSGLEEGTLMPRLTKGVNCVLILGILFIVVSRQLSLFG